MTINNYYLISYLIDFTFYAGLVLIGWFLKSDNMIFAISVSAPCFVLYLINRSIKNALQLAEETYLISNYITGIDKYCLKVFGKKLSDSMKEEVIRPTSEADVDNN